MMSADEILSNYSHLVNRRMEYFKQGRLPTSIDSEDLRQAALVGLLESSRSYEGRNGATFETYAGTRIYGSILDEIRTAKNGTRKGERMEIQAPFDDIESGEKGPYELLLDSGILACLRFQVELLSGRDRVIMELYYEDGFNLDEVGQVLGLTEGRISQIHKKIVAGLKERMSWWA